MGKQGSTPDATKKPSSARAGEKGCRGRRRRWTSRPHTGLAGHGHAYLLAIVYLGCDGSQARKRADSPDDLARMRGGRVWTAILGTIARLATCPTALLKGAAISEVANTTQGNVRQPPAT